MLPSWMTRLLCMMGVHHWVQHPHYHYILNDSGAHAYQCESCGRVRSTQSPM